MRFVAKSLLCTVALVGLLSGCSKPISTDTALPRQGGPGKLKGQETSKIPENQRPPKPPPPPDKQ